MIKYFLVLISPVLVASSQILLKKGAHNNSNKSVIKQYLNRYVILGYFTMGIVTLLNVYIFTFSPLTIGNIMIGISYVLVPIFSKIFLHEKLLKNQIIGLVIIISGIFIYGSFI